MRDDNKAFVVGGDDANWNGRAYGERQELVISAFYTPDYGNTKDSHYDYSGITLSRCNAYDKSAFVYYTLVGDDANIMLEILTNKDVARKAIEHLKIGGI